MTIKNKLLSYVNNKDGHFALWTAIMAMPLTLTVSLAVDIQAANKNRVNLKSALDSAAIAAVTHQTLTPTERAAYAKERFWLNMEDNQNVDINVKMAENYRVELEAKMKVPTLMASIIGESTIKVDAFSASELTKGATVCMLALDEDSPRTFEITEGATLDASTCGIQVNSIHREASVVDLGGEAVAKSFCIAGGAVGQYFPFANTQCSLLHNPYKEMKIPEAGACLDQAKLNALMLDWRSGRDSVDEHEILEHQRWATASAAGQPWYPTFFEKNHLTPGNYCNGLFMEGKEFILDPGVYHITSGSLVFGLGTELVGEGVTFVLHEGVDVEIRDGSILNVKGPAEGPLAGLVLAQEMGDRPLQSGLYPDVKTTITEGAMLNILGTVYLPSHKIEFLGGSLSETRAPATSFIAHHISIRDGADIGVAVDHASVDIPPIVPRSDDGARLVE